MCYYLSCNYCREYSLDAFVYTDMHAGFDCAGNANINY